MRIINTTGSRRNKTNRNRERRGGEGRRRKVTDRAERVMVGNEFARSKITDRKERGKRCKKTETMRNNENATSNLKKRGGDRVRKRNVRQEGKE